MLEYSRPDAANAIVSASPKPCGSVVDLFCGAGGLSHGFLLENYNIVAGFDVDENCRYAFEENNAAPFFARDVGLLKAEEVDRLFVAGQPRILVGCAPCQPFSTYNQKNNDPKWQLVDKFADLIVDVSPDVVSMENVPRLLEFQGGDVFSSFVGKLEAAGYYVSYSKVFAPDYGVPQRRHRLVLLASKLGPIDLIKPTHKEDEYVSVFAAIGGLRVLEAGGVDPADPMHRSSSMSSLNLERIRASRPGGTWGDWEEELRADCHKAKTGLGYRSVYGRMSGEEPSPTITTQFFGFGNGRFGHPVQDRALSLREGAILQSFPRDYKFLPPNTPVQFKKLGRMIGNAVPVLLGRAIARSISAHLGE